MTDRAYRRAAVGLPGAGTSVTTGHKAAPGGVLPDPRSVTEHWPRPVQLSNVASPRLKLADVHQVTR